MRSIARFIATARAAAQGAAEAATEEVDSPPVLLRRNGLLCNVMVERRGDRYVVSKAAWNEAIEAVLWFRREALWYNGLQADAILPYRVHGEALRRFMAWFKNSRLAERAVACCKKFLGASSKEVHARNFRSRLLQRGDRQAHAWRNAQPGPRRLLQRGDRQAHAWRNARLRAVPWAAAFRAFPSRSARRGHARSQGRPARALGGI